jgi:hypothetical protein
MISSSLNSFFSIIFNAHTNPLLFYLNNTTNTARVIPVHICQTQATLSFWNLPRKGISSYPLKLIYSIQFRFLFAQNYSTVFHFCQSYPKSPILYVYFILKEIALKLFFFAHWILVKPILCSFKIERLWLLHHVVVKLMRFAHSRRPSWWSIC